MNFHALATAISNHLGAAWFFWANVLLTLAWVAGWAARGWDDWWQLFCTTLLTITTWLLLIVVHHTQTVNEVALHRKLDELIRVNEQARNDLIGLEKREDAKEEA